MNNDSIANPSPARQENPPNTRTGLRKFILWMGGIAAVCVIALVALPIFTTHLATSWLQNNSATSASIENIDINLFTGTVRLFELDASGPKQQRLHVGKAELDIRWWPLASKRILVDAIRLSDAQIDVTTDNEGNWQVGGLRFAPAGAEAAPEVKEASAFNWGLGSDILILNDIALTYRDELFDTDVVIREISLGSHSTWRAEQSTALVVDMEVNDAPFRLDSDVNPWAEKRRFSGALRLDQLDLAKHKQTLQGLTGLTDLSGSVNLDLTVKASLNTAGVLELTASGPLSVTDIGFTLGSQALSSDSLTYDGSVEFSTGMDGDALPELTVSGDLSGQGLNIADTRLPFDLAWLGEFRISNFLVSNVNQVSMQQLQLQGLHLLVNEADVESRGDSAGLFSLDELVITGIGFKAEDSLLVESVALNDPALLMVRNTNGEIDRITELLSVYAADSGEEMVAEPAPEAAAAPAADPELADADPAAFRFAIAKLNAQAQNLLDFQDLAVTPTVNVRLTNLDLAVSNIDSGSSNPMAVQLVTGNDNMALNVSGEVAAFADPISADLQVNLSALQLPRFSSYVPGYNIDRGRLSTESTLSVIGEELKINNSVLLEQLTLSGKTAGDSAIMAKGMAMPLDVALDLLRDSNDRIKLNLPVTGSLSDPQFQSADIVRTALQKALQRAAISYVTNALQPLGTILFITNLATKAAEPRFAPVLMPPAESTLSTESKEYLVKIGELLTERPKLQLSICGIATEADREALAAINLSEIPPQPMDSAPAEQAVDEAITESEQALPGAVSEPAAINDAALLTLATSRTTAVVNFLVGQAGIAASRLFECRESIANTEGVKPGVRLAL